MCIVHGFEFQCCKYVNLSKLIYRFNAIPMKILTDFFVENSNLTLKCIWKCKGAKNSQNTLKKKSKIGGHTLPVTKVYYKTTM